MMNKIKKFVDSHSQIHNKVLNNEKNILDYINEYTKNIPNISIKEKLFLTYYEISEYPICEICKNDRVRFINNRFGTICKSRNCGYKIAAIKMKATKIKKYGRVNIVTKEYLMKKYGVENVSQLPGVGNKISKTKRLKTKEEVAEIIRKTKKTNIERFGFDNYLKTKEGKNKCRNTCLEKYGFASVLNLEHIRKKGRECLRKNSYQYYVLTNSIAEPLFSEENYIESSNDNQLKFKCKTCHNEYLSRFNNGHIIRQCPYCYPANAGYSKIEKDILTWIKEQLPDQVIEENKRILDIPGHNRKFEIDIYIPTMKIGIEVNGIYFHCDKDSLYHQQKFLSAKHMGIHLISISDYEWINKNKIWKSILKNKFNQIKYKIMARKCNVRQITDSSIKTKFLNKYHLQGNDKSSIILGLFYKNRLVSIMTFGKNRFLSDTSTIIEMIRFCSLSNFKIVGGAGKLFSYFNTNFSFNKLITYANCNYSIGNVYEKLGFTLKYLANPNYVWYKSGKILTRYQCQKHKLSSILKEKFNPLLSENINMFNNGYHKFFDCGNLVFEWIRST